MKVDLNAKFQITVPSVKTSSGYNEAKRRFDQILTEKLGVQTSNYGALDMMRTSAANASIKPLSTNALDVFSDVRVRSNATAEAIDAKLKGTAMEGLGSEFMKAEEKYGINAWFLTGLAIHESGYGDSAIAQDKNNLFGYQAYDATPYESARRFASFGDGIDTVAANLAESYLKEDGTYFNGYSIDGINTRYATDKNWANAIKAHMIQLMGGNS